MMAVTPVNARGFFRDAGHMQVWDALQAEQEARVREQDQVALLLQMIASVVL